MKIPLVAALIATVLPLAADTGGFESFGEYEIRSQMKITGNGKVVQVPIPSPLIRRSTVQYLVVAMRIPSILMRQ